MWEIVIVILIVGVAAVFAGRSCYRTLTGKKRTCSGCTDCRCHEKTRTGADTADHDH